MRFLASAIVCLAVAGGLLAEGTGDVVKAEARPIAVAAEGVVPGGWTMDFEAAKAFAASNDLPIFVSFTGSDWCIYCMKVEREVFSLPDWQAFASNRFVLVNIDLPRSPDLIRASVREKNEALQHAFEVQGFPTFLVLESDGRTLLKRFGMARELNPTNFIRETAVSIRRRPAEVRRFVSGLPRGRASAYTNLLDRLDQVEKDAQAWLQTRPARSAENMRKLQGFVDQTTTLSGALDDMEAERILGDLAGDAGEKALEQVRSASEQAAVLAELQAATAVLKDWLLGRPADTPANRQRLAGMLKRLSDVQAKLK